MLGVHSEGPPEAFARGCPEFSGCCVVFGPVREGFAAVRRLTTHTTAAASLLVRHYEPHLSTYHEPTLNLWLSTKDRERNLPHSGTPPK